MPLLRGSIILKSCTVLLHAGLLAKVSLAELQDIHFYLLCFHFSVGCWEGVDRRGKDMGKWGSLGSQDILKRGIESSERKEGMG